MPSANKIIVNNVLSQYRKRDADIYNKRLFVHEFSSFGKDILLVGGGVGCYQNSFLIYFEGLKFTNIDLHIDPMMHQKFAQIKSIQADFTTYDNFVPNMFDEVWALYSLPLYAMSPEASKLFVLRSMLCLRPGGWLRVGEPVEVNVCDRVRYMYGENFPEFGPIMEGYERAVKFVKDMGATYKELVYNSNHTTEKTDLLRKPYRDSHEFDLAVKNEIDFISAAASIPAFDTDAYKCVNNKAVRISYGETVR
ncbi:MAG: hypothetical protein FWD33_00595 [Alphaproteobacteria bacterium]|nr:hypothetical protein [Alphaproteobacteria bacterium]